MSAAGKTLEEIAEDAVESSDLARRVKGWVARAIALCLQHRSSRAMYDSQVILLRSCEKKDVNQQFAEAMPPTYHKAMAFLAAEFGSLSYVYDRCSECGFVYRAEFQDREHCPCCFAHRYYQTGTSRAVARLVVCPLSEWLKYVWQHPDLARCVLVSLTVPDQFTKYCHMHACQAIMGLPIHVFILQWCNKS